MKATNYRLHFLITFISFCLIAKSQEKSAANAQEVADKLSNPVSGIVSMPFQNNIDYGIGTFNGSKYTLNFQPVIPIALGKNLNLITRYVIPIVDQRDVTGENTSQFGLSDATVSAFFTPVKTRNGLIWGAGPAFLFPIGTDDLLSTRKWAVGPTAILLKQLNGFTYGFLVNQLWSVAGEKNRPDVNQMFLQPFIAKNWKSGAGISLSGEVTENWESSTTTVFLNPVVNGVTKLGKQIVQLGIGPRIEIAGPSGSKSDFGLRAVLTFVFSK